ncbi:MAG: hypothetical protein L6R40_008004 [Gallowayella cf. fulva]|nr:MAG: hypothetical protein L6R40_008004 [Xanthomendoza cf. fulva]
MATLSYPADDVLDQRDDFLSDDSLAAAQLSTDISAVQWSDDDTLVGDSPSNHTSHSDSPSDHDVDFTRFHPPPPPSFFTRWINSVPDEFYHAFSDASSIASTFFVAPILILPFAIYSSYRLVADFRPVRFIAYYLTALHLCLLLIGSNPRTVWLNARDGFLIQFQDRITSSCGAAGRHFNHRTYHSSLSSLLLPSAPPNRTTPVNARPSSTFTPGEPCVPSLCPNTLGFLQSPKNPYAILGLPSRSPGTPPVSTAAIANASGELLKFYHPDRIHTHHLPPETSAFIFTLIRNARQTLLDPIKRDQWDALYEFGTMGTHLEREKRHRQELVKDLDPWWGYDPPIPIQWDFYDAVDNETKWYNSCGGAEGEHHGTEREIWSPGRKRQTKGDVWELLRLSLLWWDWWVAVFGRFYGIAN